MNSTLIKVLALVAVPVALFSCKKDESTDYIRSQYESSDLPELVSYNGGTFQVNVKLDTLTKAHTEVFLPWEYRLVIGDETTEPVKITEPAKSFEVNVPVNYTESKRTVTVKAIFSDIPDGSDATEPAEKDWVKVATAEQDCALTLIEDFYWAKGNLAFKDGKFIIADKMSDAGLFFKKSSIYGIQPVSGAYDGTAYTPEPISDVDVIRKRSS